MLSRAFKNNDSKLWNWLLLSSAILLSVFSVDGFESRIRPQKLMNDDAVRRYNAVDEDSEFWNLYKEQEAGFDSDLTRQFKLEQQARRESLEAQRKALEKQGNDTPESSSAGFFSSRRPTTQSFPAMIRRSGPSESYDAWTTTENNGDGDNILLVMAMSMTATATQQSQPVLLSLMGLFLCLLLSLSFAFGTEFPSVDISMDGIGPVSSRIYLQSSLSEEDVLNPGAALPLVPK